MTNDWRGHAIVMGSPQSMGSKRIGRRRDGSPVIIDNNDQALRSWQRELRCAMAATAPGMPWGLPIRLDVRVYLLRPLDHFRGGRRGAELKVGASPVPSGGRDLDKVLRAVGDCGTAIWYVDDRLIADARIRRLWTEKQPRTEVRAVLAWAPEPEEVWQEALAL